MKIPTMPASQTLKPSTAHALAGKLCRVTGCGQIRCRGRGAVPVPVLTVPKTSGYGCVVLRHSLLCSLTLGSCGVSPVPAAADASRLPRRVHQHPRQPNHRRPPPPSRRQQEQNRTAPGAIDRHRCRDSRSGDRVTGRPPRSSTGGGGHRPVAEGSTSAPPSLKAQVRCRP